MLNRHERTIPLLMLLVLCCSHPYDLMGDLGPCENNGEESVCVNFDCTEHLSSAYNMCGENQL